MWNKWKHYLKFYKQINPNDSDYKLIEKARSNRANGEKVHSLDEVMKEFNAN